jgi:hypothetical protein
MRRLIYIASALAGCADILGIRDPVLDPDAPVIDARPTEDAPIIIDASPQIDVLAPIDAVPQVDARVCNWSYEPTNFDSCSLSATNGALDIGTATLNTDDNTLTPPGTVLMTNPTCPKIYVFPSGTVNGTLRVVGACPAVLVFLGDVRLGGTAVIDVSATVNANGTSGPGVGADNATACGATGIGGGGGPSGLAGGGGGGGGGALSNQGGGGGTGSGNQAAGGSAGTPNAVGRALRGGCSGGAGGSGSATTGAGGAAGGAIQISVKTMLTLAGNVEVRANGASGQGGRLLSGILVGTGGGGGGSGGMILLESATLVIEGPGAPKICANGGGGGEGGQPAALGGGADGQPVVCAAYRAAGGAGKANNGGDGGRGGFLTQPGGVPGAMATGGGGGGGGSVGRIILRSLNRPDLSPIVISPMPEL